MMKDGQGKAALRKHYLGLRKSADIQTLADRLMRQVSAWLEGRTFGMIGSYRPIGRFSEWDPAPVEQLLTAQNPSAQIAYPSVYNNDMDFYLSSETSYWSESEWGIEEVQAGLLVRPEEFDLIICPLLVADEAGHRLGYGKGFYDRYLRSVSPSCTKAGIGLFDPVTCIPETRAEDIPLDYYIFPHGVRHFERDR